jgi:hypothetical protein
MATSALVFDAVLKTGCFAAAVPERNPMSAALITEAQENVEPQGRYAMWNTAVA